MRLSEELYQKYLEELQELESFKLSHAEGYFGILKEVMEDPHTKHIVETLAFFIARCNLHAEKTVLNLYLRLFRQYFPYLWSPLPAMGLLQLLPSSDLMESISCREGSEISFQMRDGRRVYFQTTDAVRILPIRQGASQFEVKKRVNTRFYLPFKSMVHLKEEIGKFRLFINCLNHFPSSWSLNIALRQHLKSIRIFYDSLNAQGELCPFTFSTADQRTVFSHPIEELRSLINFPEAELFLDIEVPPHGESWKTFTLCFDLGANWPDAFPLSDESFYPYVVPIINMEKKAAEMIRCDGTEDSYPVLHPTPEKECALHSILGVYALKNHKPIPLKPTFVTTDDESYEVEAIITEKQPPQYKLLLDFKEALKSPQLIVVEAMWYQPWFDKLEQEIKAVFLNQVLKELNSRIVGSITSPEDRSALFDHKLLTRLLALKNQTHLDLQDILFLLDILKVNAKSHFREIPKQIKDLKVNLRYGSLTSEVTHEYSFLLEKLDHKNQDLVLLYFRNVKKFLDLWLSNIKVEVTLNAPNFKEPLTIREGSSHETSTLVRNLLLF